MFPQGNKQNYPVDNEYHHCNVPHCHVPVMLHSLAPGEHPTMVSHAFSAGLNWYRSPMINQSDQHRNYESLVRSRSISHLNSSEMLAHGSYSPPYVHTGVTMGPVCPSRNMSVEPGMQKWQSMRGLGISDRHYNNESVMFPQINIKNEKVKSPPTKHITEINVGTVEKLQHQYESCSKKASTEELLTLQKELRKIRAENDSLRAKIAYQEEALLTTREDNDNKDTVIALLEEKIFQHEIRANSMQSAIHHGDLNTDLKSAQNGTKQRERNNKNYQKNIQELLETIKDKDTAIETFKTDLGVLQAKLDRIGTQKKALTDENNFLKEQTKRFIYELKDHESNVSLMETVLREFSFCLAEMTNIANIIEEHLEDGDPNLSVLLGMPSLNLLSDSKTSNGPLSVADLQRQLKDVQNIKSELSDLRNKIADKYMEHLGENIKCHVQ